MKKTLILTLSLFGLLLFANKTQAAFICGNQVSYGGQNYNTINIGNQCWLKENLNIGSKINGTSTDPASISQHNNSVIEKYCYDNSDNNCSTLGGLYQWDEAMQYSTSEKSQGICPSGWHIPSEVEWASLLGINERSEILALSSGADFLTSFRDLGVGTFFWSSSDTSNKVSNSAVAAYMNHNYSVVLYSSYGKSYGFSVRCIANSFSLPSTCSSWTYSDWSKCSVDGLQTRTILSSSPSDCSGGSPILSQDCNYSPVCESTDWTCGNWSSCSSNGVQNRFCNKTKECIDSNNLSPALSQSCSYTPVCTSDTWNCGDWSTCQPNGTRTRTCQKTFDCPSIETAAPSTSEYCSASNGGGSDDTQTTNQNNIIKATVSLVCPLSSDYSKASGGSGTVISPSGLILTNQHVIDGTVGCFVGFVNNADDIPNFNFSSLDQFADIVKSSSDDMAVLRIRKPTTNLAYINISGNSVNNTMFGNRLTVYGYPGIGGDSITYSSGDFSGFLGNYIKTTAFMEHGNSGGGAYLKNGMYIGIPSGGIKGSDSVIGLILSINKINSWLSGVNLNQKTQASSDVQKAWAETNPSDIEQKIKSVDMSNIKIAVYSSTAKNGYIDTSAESNFNSPVFVISGLDNINGYYIYFGDQINADPTKVGKFVTSNEFSANKLVKSGSYYFIVKAKDNDGVISDSVIVEYKYKSTNSSTNISGQNNATPPGIDKKLSARLSGRLLLQVEQGGIIWYVDTKDNYRYKVTFDNALNLFRKLSLGITDGDLAKIPVSGSGQKGDLALRNRLKGKLLLQVQKNGEIWYVDINGYRHGVTWDNLMSLFRGLSLGIKDSDLNKIQIGD